MKNRGSNEDAIQLAVDNVRTGEYTNFNVIYNTYYNSIYSFLVKKTCRHSVAEDLTSETFIKFLNSINRYQHISKTRLGSYLFSIAYRNFVDFFRESRRAELVDIDSMFSEKFLVDHALDNKVDSKIRKAHLLNAVDLLGNDYKKIIEMFYFQQLSYNEIQDQLKISEGTVKVRLNRARKLLNNNLSKQQVFSDRA